MIFWNISHAIHTILVVQYENTHLLIFHSKDIRKSCKNLTFDDPTIYR